MSDTFESFMLSRLPLEGVAAYSILSANAVLTNQCLTKSLYATAAGQMLSMLVHSGRTLFPPGQGPARYCWSFECLRAYVAARVDGICLALLVENAQGVQFARIQETLEAFIDLVPEDEN